MINITQWLLAPVFDWFTEGFDTPDLMAARLLLDELRSSGFHQTQPDLAPPNVLRKVR
jgi:hypothetical protein